MPKQKKKLFYQKPVGKAVNELTGDKKTAKPLKMFSKTQRNDCN